jgi:glycosyltransferase involved in cell wall biosynthesis
MLGESTLCGKTCGLYLYGCECEWHLRELKLTVALCILAKNEGTKIGKTLESLARQTVLADPSHDVELHIVANGCTDDTVDAARRALPSMVGSHVKTHLHDLNPGGKSRAWNRAVHELVGPRADAIVFIDADIVFVDEKVISELLITLRSDPSLAVCTGYPVKDLSAKAHKTALDRFSLAVSDRTRHVGAICGQLYAITVSCAREIWLPDETPGEDGFLNAMVTTEGFTEPSDWSRIATMARPSHYYEAFRPLGFVKHERRMIVGTMINRWIFEHLRSLHLQEPAGRLIAKWNETNPDWVERITRQNAANEVWLIPNAILFGRFKNLEAHSKWGNVIQLAQAVAATVLTIVPAITANWRLKRVGAARSW